MNYTRQITSVFTFFFPIIWIAVFDKNNPLTYNLFLGLGGFISSLFLYFWTLWDNKKTRTLILQGIKETLNNDMVFISRQEKLLLADLMKDFIKQPGKIGNSTNNIEGRSQYKPTKKMKDRLNAL